MDGPLCGWGPERARKGPGEVRRGPGKGPERGDPRMAHQVSRTCVEPCWGHPFGPPWPLGCHPLAFRILSVPTWRGPSLVHLGPLGALNPLGPTRGHLVALHDHFATVVEPALGHLGSHHGDSLGSLWPTRHRLWASWTLLCVWLYIGPILGQSWSLLGPTAGHCDWV